MTSTITIRLADNQRNTPDLYQLDNLSTTLTIDFSGMGVDTWEKFVDFETSDGNKTRISLGTDIITLVDLSNTVTVAGVLKVNPLALLPVEGSTVDIAQRGFKTYLFNVQETINSYGYNSENRNDILLPMAESLNQLMEYHKVKILNVDSDLNFAKDEGVYGYIGVHEVRNAPTQQAFVLQVLPLPLESGGVLQIYIGVTEPGSNTYRRIYSKESDSFSSWSNPNFSLEELRTWTSEQIENISGLSTEVVADLLNLTTTVNGLSANINTLLSDVNAINYRIDGVDIDIANINQNVSTLESTMEQNNQTLSDSIDAVETQLANEVSSIEYTMNLNNNNLSARVGVTEANISTLNTKTQNLPDDGSFNPSVYATQDWTSGQITARTTPLYKYSMNQDRPINSLVTDITHEGLYIMYGWQPNAAHAPCAYLFGTAYDNTGVIKTTHLGGLDVVRTNGNKIEIKIEGAGYWQFNIYKII